MVRHVLREQIMSSLKAKLSKKILSKLGKLNIILSEIKLYA